MSRPDPSSAFRDRSASAERQQRRELEYLYMPAMPPLDLLAWGRRRIRRVFGKRQ